MTDEYATVDLLQRAAARLRAACSTDAFPIELWTVEADSWTEGRYEVGGSDWPLFNGLVKEEADYLALLSPPVALAVAAWLESESGVVDEDGRLVECHGTTEALAVARAVLREDQS